MRLIIIICIAFTFNMQLISQTEFINKGTLKYEIKVNNHKNEWWADEENDGEDDVWRKSFLENTPKFSVFYYNLKFNDKKSLYSYVGRDEKIKKVYEDDFREDNMWFHNFETNTYSYQKNIFGDVMKIEDSIKKIKWKIDYNDTREFIGFSCKKAIGVIFDSVYVFAYYTDAIMPSVGPISINGLPGAIMAITIPRLHISVVANSFSPLVNVDEIVPPKKGKPKQTNEVYKKITEATKDWGRWAHKGIWQSFL
jgi:GLPGLI family protein